MTNSKTNEFPIAAIHLDKVELFNIISITKSLLTRANTPGERTGVCKHTER
jgi:hypothetical protein